MIGKDIRHQRGINPLVRPSVDQLSFSTTVLFGRRSQQLGPAGEIVLLQNSRQGQETRDTTGGDQIVSTGVANTRQSVIFRIEIDQTPARAAGSLKGGLESVGMASDGKALLLQKGADGIVGLVLLIGSLGI